MLIAVVQCNKFYDRVGTGVCGDIEQRLSLRLASEKASKKQWHLS